MKRYRKYLFAAAFAGLVIIMFYLSAFAWGNLLETRNKAMFWLRQPVSVKEAAEVKKQNEELKTKTGQQEGGEETLPEYCIWGQKEEVTISNDNLARSAQTDAILLCGNPQLLFEDCRAPGSEDIQGCLIDQKTAWELFGSEDVQGKELSYDGETYVIRDVIPGNRKIFAYQAAGLLQRKKELDSQEEEVSEKQNAPKDALNRITMQKPKEKTLQDLTIQWESRYGISVSILDLELLRGIGGGCVLLVPLTVCIWYLVYLSLQCQKQQEIKWKILLASLSLFLASLFLFLFQQWISIPDDYIPTRWSDFSFWTDLWKTKEEAVKLLMRAPKTAVDFVWEADFFAALGFGLLAEMCIIPLLMYLSRFKSGRAL